MLTNKKVLLFVPGGEGIYGTEIKKKIQQFGAYIKVYNERPSSSVLGKISTRVLKNISDVPFNQYIRKIISENIDIHYDYVFVVRAEAFQPSSLILLRKAFPKAKFILYLWDSIVNTDTTKIIPYFDKSYSYDVNDVNDNSLLSYRPTFYLDQYSNIPCECSNEFDLFFFGTIHSDRIDVLDKIKIQFHNQGLFLYSYMYFPGRIMYYKKYIYDNNIRHKSINDFHFSLLNLNSTIDYVSRSKASLDIQHPAQSALTLRPIEMLGAKRKLVTTNYNIKSYDFYDEQNILIIDRNNPVIEKEFFSLPYRSVSSDIYKKYSLHSWLFDVFA